MTIVSPPEIPRASRRTWWFIAAVLVVHAGLGLHAAWRLSLTHDEYWHLPVGLITWKTGRFDYDSINPPLTRMWCAAPLVVLGAEMREVDPSVGPGGLGDIFREGNADRFRLYYAVARGMNVLLSVIAGLLVAAWSRELFGQAASMLSVLLWAACPTILANAALVTPDLGVTFFYVATLFSLWRFAQYPGWRHAILSGALLGFAQTAKFTALLLIPMCLVLWFVARRGVRPVSDKLQSDESSDSPSAPQGSVPATSSRCRGHLVLLWMALLAVCLVTWNGVYLFRGSCSSFASFEFHSASLRNLKDSAPWLSRVPVPLPRDYLIGLDAQRRIMEHAHPVYLDREWSTKGFWQYYLMTLWYKLPHALQALVAFAGLFVLQPRGKPRLWCTQIFLLTPVAVLLTVASAGGMQLGIRYVLPVIPFLILFAGQTARWLDAAHGIFSRAALKSVRTWAVLVPAFVAPLSLRYHPHHLTFFNEFAGGPIGGRQHLVDSNLDWGQALRELTEELERRNITDVNLLYFGTELPAFKYHLPAPSPQPGWYAVSVNFVQGRPHLVRDPNGPARAVGLEEYGPFFRFFEPVAHPGYAIDLYELTADDILRWQRARRGGFPSQPF